MLQNAYFVAKIGADTAKNEQYLPKFCQPTLSDVSAAPPARKQAQRVQPKERPARPCRCVQSAEHHDRAFAAKDKLSFSTVTFCTTKLFFLYIMSYQFM